MEEPRLLLTCSARGVVFNTSARSMVPVRDIYPELAAAAQEYIDEPFRIVKLQSSGVFFDDNITLVAQFKGEQIKLLERIDIDNMKRARPPPTDRAASPPQEALSKKRKLEGKGAQEAQRYYHASSGGWIFTGDFQDMARMHHLVGTKSSPLRLIPESGIVTYGNPIPLYCPRAGGIRMIPAETIIVYLDCLGEEGNNSLVACYRRSACGARTARCSVVAGKEYAHMDPNGVVFLNHLIFTGSPGIITLTARLGELGNDGNFYPLQWPSRDQIIASFTLYVDSKKPRREKQNLEQRYLGIDPRVGLAYNSNLVALSVICTPTPALLDTKVFFSRMEVEVIEQAEVLDNITDTRIVVRSPPFPECKAIVSLVLKDRSIPCEEKNDAIFEFQRGAEGATEHSAINVSQDDIYFADQLLLHAVETSFTQFQPTTPFFHFPILSGQQLTTEILDEVAERSGHKREGFTRLMIASYAGDIEMVNTLLDAGDNPEVPDTQGWTALDWAKEASASFPGRDYSQVLSLLEDSVDQAAEHLADMQLAPQDSPNSPNILEEIRNSNTSMLTKAAQTSPPIPFEKITVGKIKGYGGQGTVYEGTVVGVNKKVAIKSLWDTEAPHFQRGRNDRSLTDTDLRAMQQEIEKKVKREHEIVAAMATHPHVVRFVGISFFNHPTDVKLHRIFILTELVEAGNQIEGGNSLQYFYFKNTINHKLLVRILMETADAMQYMHSKEYLHRNLKTSNLLLDELLHVKICGFGISRPKPTEKDINMTNSVGSDLWSAPEVLNDQPYGERADVFSFGVIISELHTQEAPKPRTAFSPRPWEFVPRGPVSKHLVPTEGPALALWQLMLRCTQYLEKDRPTFGEIHQELSALFAKIEGKPETAPKPNKWAFL